MSVGAVGLIVGAATGAAALSKADELKAACAGQEPCPTENEPLADDADTLATVSTVSFIAGGVLLAGGTAWLLFELLSGDGGEPNGAHASPVIGPGFAGVKGAF